MHQPHYLPWLGYVDKADRADLFVFVDQVQFVRKQWQNRNYVKTQQGSTLLTVPVLQESRAELISEKIVDERRPWRKKHRRTIEQSYHGAPYWSTYGPGQLELYDAPWERLADVAVASAIGVFTAFGVTTPWRRASDIGAVPGAKTEMIAGLCHAVGATVFVSGDRARDYLDVGLLARHGIEVEWQNFVHPTYRQLYPEAGFVPRLAAFDLLFNVGPASLDLLRQGRSAVATK
jgi:hypothetical protein